MTLMRQFWQRRWLIVTAVVGIALPRDAKAHGELLIQLVEITRQIKAATNNYAPLYLARAELHREHKDWSAATFDYNQAAKFDPQLSAVDFYRAKMLDDSGRLEESNVLFDKIINRNPNDGEALVGRARVLVKQGKIKAAITDFQSGLELLAQPQPEYFLEFARVLAAENRSSDALLHLDNGVKKLGVVGGLQEYALELELARKNYPTALGRIDTIIKIAPRPEKWYAQRGEILIAAGRATEAQKSFEAARAAINTLPARLQNGPSMQNLLAQVQAKLSEINANEK